MFILSNRNIVLTTRDGDESRYIQRGFLGDVPDRFCQSAYFSALVKDGKIVLSGSRKDTDVVSAAEQGEKTLEETVKRTRKAKKD